jgi:superfamily II DNA or RNA helicase
MRDFFAKNKSSVNLSTQTLQPNQGFRVGQLGALHATLAHFSVYEDPASVCLPTGYGKTTVMMALPFLMSTQRVLVVEPSNALRKQVSSHFRELSTLRRIGAITDVVENPAVLKQEGRPATVDEWTDLANYDVVISTPGSLSPALAPGAPSDLFDLVIIDEAHHVPADTWEAFLDHYKEAKFVFLTATPFRRDGRAIPGKLVYRYPVTRAAKEGAFHPVQFEAAPVENNLDNDHIDRVIAETAVRRFRSDAAEGFDHRLFVRAATIEAGRALVELYRELGLRIDAIDSKLSKRTQDDCERRLDNGELEGIVCVDMFGEGYDFPKFKIAALHAPHRSLVPTIQFIGRFARVDASTGPATIIAPLARMKDATGTLLQEGVELAQMIDQAAQREISGDEREQAMVEQLKVKRVAESDYDAVSPRSLELYAHVRVFRCSVAPDFSLIGETVGRALRVVKQWTSEDGQVSLVLTADENPPNWATSNVLMNVRHDVFLFIYRADSQLCYIGSTRRTEKIYLGLIDKVCADNFRALSYEETSRARAGLDAVRFYNVGLRNTTFNSQGETYRTLTGPAAERAVTAGDSRAFSQGHFFGSGLNGGEKETIGASSGSRIWSNQSLTVASFVRWVDALNARLVGTAPFSATQLDIIRATTTLRRIPDVVIAATWPKAGFKSNPKVRFQVPGNHRRTFRRLAELEIASFHRMTDTELTFCIVSEEVTVRMKFSLGQGRMISEIQDEIFIEIESATDNWMAISDWLCDHPPLFYAADKSSFEGVNEMAAPQLQVATLAAGDADFLDWTGCEVTIEFLVDNGTDEAMRKRADLGGLRTVQEHLEQHLLSRNDLAALFYDHRAGEAADYIAVTVSPTRDIDIALYHCKGAGGAPGGRRVNDVYEVAGQVVKSVFYCNVATLLAHMLDRMDARHKSPSTFKKGDLPSLTKLLDEAPATKISFTVIGVQPGIRKSQVTAHLADLMVFGINYARQGGASKAFWLVSE